MSDRTDDLAALLIAGDHPTAERAIDALREPAWRRWAEGVVRDAQASRPAIEASRACGRDRGSPRGGTEGRVTGVPRDDLYDRAVRELLQIAVGTLTLAEAHAALELLRARLVERIDAEGDPDAAAMLRRVLSRLIDETESGGRRA